MMVIVRADGHLEVEAMIPNRDIGFVSPGQEVQVKIDTFKFTRNDLRRGKVLIVSHDAIVRDKPQDKSNPTKTAGRAH
jgi:hemolysin D